MVSRFVVVLNIAAIIQGFNKVKYLCTKVLAGKDKIMKAYHEAVKEKYRFFSFGDSMFIK